MSRVRSENGQLKRDMEWLAGQAQMSKKQAEEAIKDLTAYQ
jgi:hypothetical protein